MSTVLCCSLFVNRESKLDFQRVCGWGEAQGSEKCQVLWLVENRGWKGKLFQSVKRSS